MSPSLRTCQRLKVVSGSELHLVVLVVHLLRVVGVAATAVFDLCPNLNQMLPARDNKAGPPIGVNSF